MNSLAPSTIGRYVTCEKCHCKFWVYVPPLAETTARERLVELSAATSPVHEHRPDSPGMIRQESLLATIHDDLLSLRRQIVAACVIFVAGCAAVIATLLLK